MTSILPRPQSPRIDLYGLDVLAGDSNPCQGLTLS